MTCADDLRVLRDALDCILTGALPTWRVMSTDTGQNVQQYLKALVEREMRLRIENVTVRATVAKARADVDAERATNERLTADIERLEEVVRGMRAAP